jgi:hypothetical protein
MTAYFENPIAHKSDLVNAESCRTADILEEACTKIQTVVLHQILILS